MTDAWLEDAERERFARYLRAEITTSEAMLRQMQEAAWPDVVLQRERTLLAAFSVVLDRITSGETVTVRKEESNNA